jgi:D-beta-D-heptose 7-phosphate kinase/D-beta-D-heptose 1-phosphate adenosyltransferase
VDYVVPFDDDSPRDLISAARPDIYVKGGDYSRDTLPEAALVESLGGAVCILPYVGDRSTSGIIERIRRAVGA